MSRTGMLLLLVAAAGVVPANATGARDLGIEQRISAQAAIEGVLWRHRIWPADNPGPKPALQEVLPESALRARVEDSMLESRALEQLWGHPISDADLQAEIERMVGTSRAPDVLQEIFDALGNDPILLRECLARPILADRLMRDAYARDPRFHRDLKTAIEQSLARHPAVADLRSEGHYGEAVWVLGGGRPGRAAARGGERVVPMSDENWRLHLTRLQAAFDPRAEALPVGTLSELQEDDEAFFVQAILEKSSARLRIATLSWRKTPFDEWWARTKADLVSGSPVDEATPLGGESSDAAAPVPPLAGSTCAPDTWTAVQTSGAPSPRESFSAVWTGSEMIVWGGYNGTMNLDTNTGGRYTPATNSWTATTTTNAPELRDSHTGVWTGTKMVIWGGGNEVFVPKNTGGRYDPTTNSWLATATSNNAAARLYHTAVWSGTRMIIFGGWNGTKDLDTGALYDPGGDSWTATPKSGTPTARDGHSAVWTGSLMVIWGGEDDNTIAQDTGARFDGTSWSATAAPGAGAARWMHSTVWSGTRMIVWGGFDGTVDLNTGFIYDPGANSWSATPTTGAPAAREQHVAVWADSTSEMIVWGGENDLGVQLSTGGRYSPGTGLWTTTSTSGAPLSGRFSSAVWTGSEMIVWGGYNQVDLNSGGRYCDVPCTSPAPAGSATILVESQAGAEVVSWAPLAGADLYDLVRGSLDQLNASGGDFTSSTQACLINDQPGTSYADTVEPAVGSGFFYLVRGLTCGGVGTYDSLNASQVGSRDAEIDASANHCP
jgi:N-acetylneuraminic acid mutarotase